MEDYWIKEILVNKVLDLAMNHLISPEQSLHWVTLINEAVESNVS